MCGFPDCGRPIYARGLCNTHNRQKREGKKLRPIGEQHKLRALVAHPFDPTLALVPLPGGRFAVISAVDVPSVGRFNWHVLKANGRLYAGRHHRDNTGKKVYLLLHRFVADLAGLDLTCEVDHEDGNGLDCRRANLRSATRAQQTQNTRTRSDNTSGVKGVYFARNVSKWTGEVIVEGKKTRVGYFATKKEAAEVVRATRERLHGAFANHGKQELQ